MNLLPEHLDYNFTQILFIGEKQSVSDDYETTDALEKLEDEDEARVKHLQGYYSIDNLRSRRGCCVQGFEVEQGRILAGCSSRRIGVNIKIFFEK
jgi:hypothetical protein